MKSEANNEVKNEKQVRVGIGIAILDEEGRILLLRRNKAAGKDWEWQFPGGGVEFGESLQECAIREAKEETNLDIKNPEIFIALDSEITEKSHWVGIGLKTTEFTGTPKVTEPHNFTEIRFFEFNNLPDNIYIPSFKMIKRLMET